MQWPARRLLICGMHIHVGVPDGEQAIRVIKAVSNPDAFNVGLNLGKSAGGSLAEHLHMHVVPRWSGDANFITIVGETKVIPQLLRDTRALLAAEWAASA